MDGVLTRPSSALALTLLLCASGCSRREPPAPARVLVDGNEIKMPSAFGARVPARRGGGYSISLFSHAELDCPAYLRQSRRILPNEIHVHAYVGARTTNVGVNISNSLGRPASLTREPTRVGDILEICVPEEIRHKVERNGTTQEVAFSGTISAHFCGDAE